MWCHLTHHGKAGLLLPEDAKAFSHNRALAVRVNAEEADGDQIHEGKVQENESVVWGSPIASFQTKLVVFATATSGGP